MFTPLLLSLASPLLTLPLSLASRTAISPRHIVEEALPGRWYHEPDDPVHFLFRRQDIPTDGVNYPQVGSSTWYAAYPSGTPDTNTLPRSWVNALNSAVAAGKIPDIPIASLVDDNPTYPSGVDPAGKDVCTAYYQCRASGDIWDAPTGVLGVGFDDGPSSGSAKLYDYLKTVHQRATHFMIGLNILNNPSLFLRAFEELRDDIAVHTWTHPHLSTLSNLEIVGEFGWTMQLIHNSTGGRLPRFFRPPYGDMDNRVRAVTREVFGLTPIMWNHDTEDWSLSTGGTTLQAINDSMTQWLSGPKSPGLIILEHELTDQTAQAFQNAYPTMVSKGWNLESAMSMDGNGAYFNSKDDNSSVVPVTDVIKG